MEITGLKWAGVRTERFEEMRSFLTEHLGLEVDHAEDAMVSFDLPNGDTFELFGPGDADHEHFTTGPVVGFGVTDIDAARRELEAAGIEFIGGIEEEAGMRWTHLRGPDGNVYELTQS